MSFKNKLNELREILVKRNSKTLSDNDKKLIKEMKKALNNLTSLDTFNYFNDFRLERLDELTANFKTSKEIKSLLQQYKNIKGVTGSNKWKMRVAKVLTHIVKTLEANKLDYMKVPTPKGKTTRLNANVEATNLIKEKGNDRSKYTDEELFTVAKFTGFGGLGKIELDNGTIVEADANEYYTPREIAKSVWDIIKVSQAKESQSMKILDPSCGTGMFSQVAPKNVSIEGVELNPTSGTIASVLNANTKVHAGKSFEEFAYEKDYPIYDGIVTNVPFGSRDDKYRLKDKKYSHIKSNEDYFILKSLDLLKEGSRAVFMTTSSSAQRESKKDFKREALKKGCFVGGFRLPSSTFSDTGTNQVVDVLVFEKHPDETVDLIKNGNYIDGTFDEAIAVSNSSESFLNGTYFEDNDDHIIGLYNLTNTKTNKDKRKKIGDYQSKETMVENAIFNNDTLNHHKQKDTVNTPLDQKEIDNLLKATIKEANLSNTFGYGEIIPLVEKYKDEQNRILTETTEKELNLELEALTNDEKGLNKDDFIKLFDKANELEFFKDGLVSLYRPIIYKYTAIKNARKGSYSFLMSIFFDVFDDYDLAESLLEDNPDDVEHYTKPTNLAKLSKTIRPFGGVYVYKRIISILTSDTADDLKGSIDENTLTFKNSDTVSPNGTNMYNPDSLSDDEMLKDDIGLYIDDSGEAKAMTMEDSIELAEGMNYYDAISMISNLDAYNIKPEILEQKKAQMMNKLSDFKKTVRVEDLSFSIEEVNRYFTSIQKKRLISELMSIGGADLNRIFEDKRLNSYDETIDVARQFSIGKKAVSDQPSFYREYLEKGLLDASLKLGLKDYVSDYGSEKKDDEGDKKRLSAIGYLRSLNTTAFNGTRELLKYYIKTIVLEDVEFKETIMEELDNNSSVAYKKPLDLDNISGEPVEELRGALTDELIQKARIYQNEDARDFARNLKGTIAQDTGLGKGHREDDLIITTDGLKQMKDLKVGDYVIGSNGKPTKIIGVHHRGILPTYRVDFKDGTYVDCDEDHIWYTRYTNNAVHRKEFKNMTIREMIKKPIYTLSYDKRYGTTQKRYRYGIPHSSPAEFSNDKKLGVHPYVLGALLGNGSFSQGSVTVVFKNRELTSKFIKLINDDVRAVEMKQRSNCVELRLSKKGKKNSILNELKKQNLYGHNSYDKFIPEDYLYSSLENRKELFQGLVDTDGHILKNGTIEYGTSSKQLMEDYRTLGFSIGKRLGIVSVKKNPSYTYNGEKRYSLNPAYSCTEYTNRAEVRAISNITKIDDCKIICISVEAEDRLYMMGKGFNLTHNSYTMLMTSVLAIKSNRANRILVLTPNSVLKNLYEKEFLTSMTKEWQDKTMSILTKTIVSDVRKIKQDKNIKIIVAPHSIIESFKLKDETLDMLTTIPSEKGEKGGKTPFFKLVETYPDTSKGKVFFENLGIDAIIIDEQQFFKNGTSSFNVAKASIKSSASHIMMQYICEYIRKSRGDNRGAVSVTATPYTNSPTEIISNMAISGGYLDNYGNPKQGFESKEHFIDNFVIVEDLSRPKINGMGMTSTDTFTGFSSFEELKDTVNSTVKFRNAEGEQARVKGLKVKPDYTEFSAEDELDFDIANTFKGLASLNDMFQTTIKEKAQNKDKKVDLDSIPEVMVKTVGETFGFINRVRNLSNGQDFANGITKLKVKNGTTVEQLLGAFAPISNNKKAWFTFGLYKEVDFNTVVNCGLRKNIKKTIPYPEHIKAEMRANAKSEMALKRVEETIENNRVGTIALKEFAPDFIEVRDGTTYFNAPTIDEDSVQKIVKALKTKKLIEDENDLFDMSRFTKYKSLLKNLKLEFTRKSFSKQIVFSDRPILTQMIIKQFIEKASQDGLLPDLTVHLFSKSGGLKEDKRNSLEIQDKFNGSDEPDIMVYGKAGITGVDFNKNVSAVHLMNIPDTPDIHHQAMGRAVRQGNSMDNVSVYKYFTTGTFDTFLDKLVSGKKDWINSLSSKEKSENEAMIDTSSASQIMSSALSKYGDLRKDNGDKYTTEEMVNMYMEFQKQEEIKDQKEINAVKLKKDIERYFKFKKDKQKIDVRGANSYIATELELLSKNIKTTTFKEGYLEFPDALKEDSITNGNTDDIKQLISDKLFEAKEDAHSRFEGLLGQALSDVMKNDDDLSELADEIRDVKKELKKKKITDELRASLKNRLENLESTKTHLLNTKFFDKKYDRPTLRNMFNLVMSKVGENYFPTKTTEEDLINASKKRVDFYISSIKTMTDNIIGSVDIIDENIKKLAIELKSKENTDAYGDNSKVKINGENMLISEVISSIEV